MPRLPMSRLSVLIAFVSRILALSWLCGNIASATNRVRDVVPAGDVAEPGCSDHRAAKDDLTI